MNRQLDLLWRGHSFAKATRDFVSHVTPPGSLREPPSPLRGEGLETVARAQLNSSRMIRVQTVKTTLSSNWKPYIFGASATSLLNSSGA
jgi:hypothetical protein